MADIVIDTFNAPDWSLVPSRSGELGASWTNHPNASGSFYIFQKWVYPTAVGVIYASGIPNSAEYSVECDYKVLSHVGSLGPAGRIQPGAHTYYGVYYDSNVNHWLLLRVVNGGITTLSQYIAPVTLGQTYRVRLELLNATKKVFIDGVERISHSDNTITGAGRAGIRTGGSFEYNQGKQISNFRAFDDSVAARPRSQVVGFVGL